MRPRYGPLRDALFKKRRAPRLEEYEPLRDQYLDYAAGDFWQAAVALGRDWSGRTSRTTYGSGAERTA